MLGYGKSLDAYVYVDLITAEQLCISRAEHQYGRVLCPDNFIA